mmetsp:Transcript_25760/g.65475  ORF Transcript_25760/g.65475 Transcript_25760/m.65475 type:complete len:221 (-) Transcript_25760:989-1651(-)
MFAREVGDFPENLPSPRATRPPRLRADIFWRNRLGSPIAAILILDILQPTPQLVAVRRIAEAVGKHQGGIQLHQTMLDVPLAPTLALVERVLDILSAEAFEQRQGGAPDEGGRPAQAVQLSPRRGVLRDASIHETGHILQGGHEEDNIRSPEMDKAEAVKGRRQDLPEELVLLVHRVACTPDVLNVFEVLWARRESGAPIWFPFAVTILKHRGQQQLQHV